MAELADFPEGKPGKVNAPGVYKAWRIGKTPIQQKKDKLKTSLIVKFNDVEGPDPKKPLINENTQEEDIHIISRDGFLAVRVHDTWILKKGPSPNYPDGFPEIDPNAKPKSAKSNPEIEIDKDKRSLIVTFYGLTEADNWNEKFGLMEDCF